jgi:CHASE3 domain sensor protein
MTLSIRAQLIDGCAIGVVLLLAVLGVSFMGMSSMAKATDEIVHVDIPADIAVQEFEVLVLEQTATYADYIITHDTDDLAIIDHEIEAVEEHVVSLYDQFDHDPEIDDLINTFHEAFGIFVHTGDLLTEEVGHTNEGEITAGLIAELHELEAEEVEMLLELEDLALIAEENVEHAAGQAKSAENSAILMATVLAVIALAISAAIVLIRIHKIMGSLSAVEAVATDMSENTLSSCLAAWSALRPAI